MIVASLCFILSCYYTSTMLALVITLFSSTSFTPCILELKFGLIIKSSANMLASTGGMLSGH